MKRIHPLLFSIIPFMNKFLTFSATIALLIVSAATVSLAEEKSMWNKFVDFFSPSQTVEGDGPLYDELRALDNKISRTEGKYSRERRPGNKTRLRKELDQLKADREKLVVKIKEEEKKQASASSSSAAVSSKPSSSSAKVSAPLGKQDVCKNDTIYVHDTTTVVVHDTLYVIVADKPAAESKKDSTQESNKN